MLLHTNQEIHKRLQELMEPVDKQIMMCNDVKELLLFACGLMRVTNSIFVKHLGINGAKLMYEDIPWPVQE